MSDKPKPRRKPAQTDRELLDAARAHIIQLERDMENLKSFGLTLAARVLRLELAVSALDTDNTLRSILYPEVESV